MGIVKEYLSLFAQRHDTDPRTLRCPGNAKRKFILRPSSQSNTQQSSRCPPETIGAVVHAIDQTTDRLLCGYQTTLNGQTDRRYAGWFKCHIGLGCLYLGLLATRLPTPSPPQLALPNFILGLDAMNPQRFGFLHQIDQ
jgi:hypothetical protein